MLKNKLLKQLAFFATVIATFALVACGNEDIPQVEVSDFNASANFITSDVLTMTNQEAFELMIQNPVALHILLDLVDYALLRDEFDINPEHTTEFWENIQADIHDLDDWFMQTGLNDEAYVLRILVLDDLRMSTARAISNDEDPDVLAGLVGPELLRLRAEAGLEIFNATLAQHYEDMLENVEADYVLATPTSNVSADVVARVNNVDITIAELFHYLSTQIGLEFAFDEVDSVIEARYDVDPADIYEQIEELREVFGDDFYDIIESAGFLTLEELFDYFEGFLVQEVILRAHRPPSEERLMMLYEQMGATAGASHILVDTEEEALALIAQLEAADADEFAQLFADLAAEYSNCPSGVQNGGDLGTWERGRMVPEFDHAVFELLTVGEFTLEPVWNPTHNGYHIIYKTFLEATASFEDVRDDLIQQEINMQLQWGMFDDLMMEFRVESGLTFSNEILQRRFEFFAGN